MSVDTEKDTFQDQSYLNGLAVCFEFITFDMDTLHWGANLSSCRQVIRQFPCSINLQIHSCSDVITKTALQEVSFYLKTD